MRGHHEQLQGAEILVSFTSRFFGRQQSDPADALIDRLTDRSLDDRRNVLGILFGGPHSRKVQRWILSRPDSDVASALLALWDLGRPDIAIKQADRYRVNDQCKKELIGFVVDRWRQGLFATAMFERDVRENTKRFRRELKKRGAKDPFGIPEEAWQSVHGREPVWTDETITYRRSPLNEIRGALRLADMAATDLANWEPIRRRSIGRE